MKEKELYDHLIKEDDISWQAVIFDAVKTEQMNPWDIDLYKIAEHFTQTLSSLKDMNFRIPGKVILASAILLKLKSIRFVQDDMSELDRLIASGEQQEQDMDDTWEDDDYEDDAQYQDGEEPIPKLIPRTPQPRSRKVSVYDLVKALEKAIEVNNRRKVLRNIPEPKVKLPNKVFDLSIVMQDVYQQVLSEHEKADQPVRFSNLIKSESKEDKVYTFIPLLHLSNMRKVELHQDQPFADFEVELLTNQKSIAAEVKQLESEQSSET